MERPVLFKGEMVNAILSGKKTQTRRIVKPQPVAWSKSPGLLEWKFLHLPPEGLIAECPYGIPGDTLWIRETFAVHEIGESTHIVYRADCGSDGDGAKWRPSIFMPRKHSRISLKITDVRVERLQDISEGDVMSEGIEHDPNVPSWLKFAFLWNSINANRGYDWDSNPWVWVIEFEKI
jgi:hypothetical protein